MRYQTKYTPELANYLKSVYPKFIEEYEANRIFLFSDKSCGAYNSYDLDCDEVSTGEFIDRCLAAWNGKITQLSSGLEVRLDKNCLFFKSCVVPLKDFEKIKKGVDDWRGMWPEKRIWTKSNCPDFTRYLRKLRRGHLAEERGGKLVLSPHGEPYNVEIENVTVSDGEFLDAINKLNLDSIVVGKKIQVEGAGVKVLDETLSFEDVEEISKFLETTKSN